MMIFSEPCLITFEATELYALSLGCQPGSEDGPIFACLIQLYFIIKLVKTCLFYFILASGIII